MAKPTGIVPTQDVDPSSTVEVLSGARSEVDPTLQERTEETSNAVWLRQLMEQQAAADEFEVQYGFFIWHPFGPRWLMKSDWYPVVLPQSKVRLAWEAFGMLLMIFEVLTIPYRLVFSFKPKGTWLAVEYFVVSYFMMDVCSQFFLGKLIDDHTVMAPGKIIKSYLKGWFLIDFLATFPFSAVIGTLSFARSLRLIRFARYLKIIRLLKVLRLNEKMLMMEQSYAHLRAIICGLRVLKSLFYLIFLSHYAACIWYLMGYAFIPDEVPQSCKDRPWTCEEPHTTWLTSGITFEGDPDELSEDDLYFQLYVNALYFSLETMTCVGYGDMNPDSPAEKMYMTVFFVASVTVFSGLISSLQSVFMQFFTASLQRQKMMCTLNAWLRYRDLGLTTKRRVHAYISYLYEKEKSGLYRAQPKTIRKVFSMISSDLQTSCSTHVIWTHIKDAPYMKWFTNYDNAIGSLCRKTEIILKSPGDYLCVVGETARSFYSINDGTLMLFDMLSHNGCATHHDKEYMRLLATSCVFDLSRAQESKMDQERRLAKQTKEEALLESILEHHRARRPVADGGLLVTGPAFVGQRCLLHLEDQQWCQWQWPFSGWFASYSNVVDVSMSTFREVLEQFPFLKEHYRSWRKEELAAVMGGNGCSEEKWEEFPKYARADSKKRHSGDAPGKISQASMRSSPGPAVSSRASPELPGQIVPGDYHRVSPGPSVSHVSQNQIVPINSSRASSGVSKLRQPFKLPGAVSEFEGTWEYLCGQREYEISRRKNPGTGGSATHGKLGNELWFTQIDPVLSHMVRGLLTPVDGGFLEARLSNRGRIQLRHFTEAQHQDHITSRYMAPGSRKWGKPVVANRVNREIIEMKELERSEKLCAQMKILQVEMAKSMNRYADLVGLSHRAEFEKQKFAQDKRDAKEMERISMHGTPVNLNLTRSKTSIGGSKTIPMEQEKEEKPKANITQKVMNNSVIAKVRGKKGSKDVNTGSDATYVHQIKVKPATTNQIKVKPANPSA